MNTLWGVISGHRAHVRAWCVFCKMISRESSLGWRLRPAEMTGGVSHVQIGRFPIKSQGR